MASADIGRASRAVQKIANHPWPTAWIACMGLLEIIVRAVGI